jgi:hypothetical protein
LSEDEDGLALKKRKMETEMENCPDVNDIDEDENLKSSTSILF